METAGSLLKLFLGNYLCSFQYNIIAKDHMWDVSICAALLRRVATEPPRNSRMVCRLVAIGFAGPLFLICPGILYAKGDAFREAVSCYNRALEISKNSSSRHVTLANRAATYIKMHMYAQALEDSEEAARLCTDYAMWVASALVGLYIFFSIGYFLFLYCKLGNGSNFICFVPLELSCYPLAFQQTYRSRVWD